MFTKKKVMWICPEEKGGILSYTKSYQPFLKEVFENSEYELEDPYLKIIKKNSKDVFKNIETNQPQIIHFQHEYGIWGSKNPPFYFFPKFVQEVKKKYPEIKFVATAHNILGEKAEYSVTGDHQWLKQLLNKTLVPHFRKIWNEKTWSPLDAVIVHSKLQVEVLKKAGCNQVLEIPHFVPQVSKQNEFKTHPLLKGLESKKKIVVFGYFSKDKGQDIAVKALKLLSDEYVLILAGGVRQSQDMSYYSEVKKLRKDLNITNRVIITEYLEDDFIDGIYDQTDLVVVPFRYTSGSGSLAQALARKMPTVASNIALNIEISERVPGCIELFETENPESLATKIKDTMNNQEKMGNLRLQAGKYAENYSIKKMALMHLEFYKRICP